VYKKKIRKLSDHSLLSCFHNKSQKISKHHSNMNISACLKAQFECLNIESKHWSTTIRSILRFDWSKDPFSFKHS
jgi:hypothetical protein